MASSKIYICDGCGSYVSEQYLHAAIFLLRGATTYNAVTPAFTTAPAINQLSTNIQRDICPSCAEGLIEKFKLNKTNDSLNREAFQGFNLSDRLDDPIT